MPEVRFLRPLDILFFRTNKLFGEAGQHSETQMPPWPSVVAGAIRSRILVDNNVDMDAFINGEALPDPLDDILGIPSNPGSFRVSWFSVARERQNTVEPFIPLPADLFADEDNNTVFYIKPHVIPEQLYASCVTPQITVLKQEEAKKPLTNLWLNGRGLRAYLRGEPLDKEMHTVRTDRLWKKDLRLGIALDATKRVAEAGRIYTSEGIAMESDTGFIVFIEGSDGIVPEKGLIRFGGDGRGAEIYKCDICLPEPDWDRIASERRFRLILTTPGLFKKGWYLPGMADDGVTWHGPDGIIARLTSAVVPRHRVVSGWDLANNEPKLAIRAVSPGSVYWFETAEIDGPVLVEGLKKLTKHGLGLLSPYPDRTRLCEGFNNVMIAIWTDISQ